jgi:hypothetical protein
LGISSSQLPNWLSHIFQKGLAVNPTILWWSQMDLVMGIQVGCG